MSTSCYGNELAIFLAFQFD